MVFSCSGFDRSRERMIETASSRVIGALRGADDRLPDELSQDSGVAFDLAMTPVRI